MRKTPFVLGATTVGLALVLNYHSSALSITLPATGSGRGPSSGQGASTAPSARSTLAAGTGSTPPAGAPPAPSGASGSAGGSSGGGEAARGAASSSSTVGAGNAGTSFVQGGSSASGTSVSGTPSPPGSTGTVTSSPGTTQPTVTTQPPTTTTTAAPRVVNGNLVNYAYGSLQLQVTAVGGKITKITPVVDQASDSRSAQINSQAIPELTQEALQAQSASIHTVSGATYTSNAYIQSLQSALDQL